MAIRRIAAGDAGSLASFYNGLSEESKRLFRPLDVVTSAAVCEGVIRDNEALPEEKLDLVAIADGRIVGWGFVHGLRSPDPVLGLSVADAWRARGVGTALLDAVMAAARERRLAKVTLTVVQENDVARGMYERRGFVRTGALVGEDGLDYYRMQADLAHKRRP